MEPANPYAPPSQRAPTLAGEDLPTDEADLFVLTLAPPLLKAAIGVIALAGGMMLLLCLRLLLALHPTKMAIVLEVAHVTFGAMLLIVAWGIRRGMVAMLLVGLVLCPVVAIASLFALLTGSPGGLFSGLLSITGVVLLALNFDAVRRIGLARAKLRASAVGS